MGPSYFPGDVLITVATGFISDAEAERAGLVQTHAYAVLDIRKIQVWASVIDVYRVSSTFTSFASFSVCMCFMLHINSIKCTQLIGDH